MDAPTGSDTGQLEKVGRGPLTRRDEIERRRELVAGMMRIGLSVRRMVEALAEAKPPIYVGKSTIGDDRLVIRKRWIASYTDTYGDHVAEVWSTYSTLLELAMEKAVGGDVAAMAEARKINTQMGRMVGAFAPDQLLLLGPGGGPIQVEHSGISAQAQIERGRSVLERYLGPPALEAASTEHVKTNGNGSSANGHE